MAFSEEDPNNTSHAAGLWRIIFTDSEDNTRVCKAVSIKCRISYSDLYYARFISAMILASNYIDSSFNLNLDDVMLTDDGCPTIKVSNIKVDLVAQDTTTRKDDLLGWIDSQISGVDEEDINDPVVIPGHVLMAIEDLDTLKLSFPGRVAGYDPDN